jgi:patatin-related protein
LGCWSWPGGAARGGAAVTAEARSREVRFGLVMYGGVSLAIYINGVSHEFCRAVRGEGVYKLLKILTDSEIVVDIVSGSSAGGINGIFLGFALANAKDFGGMAQLWRQRGDIERLLRPFDADPETCQSLLDSEGYYEPELGKALKGLPSYPTGDYDPRTNEIDLFITGTHVDGEVYTVVDDDGHSIDVKDHRTVFWLKHRAGRKEQLHDDDTTRAALARLARLTSCFPAAFAPVRVEAGPRGSGDGGDSRDALLRQWGDFTNERYFLDGGVLNNKPFSHTIKAIFRRTQVRPVDRYLAYVEPDPDFFPDQRVEAPTFVEATIEGAFGIKGYESIADDLQLIHRHNSAVDRYWHVCRDLRGKLPETDPAWWQTGEGTRWGVVLPSNAHIKSDGFSVAQRTTYARSRFSALAMRSLSGILTKDGDREKIAPEDHLDVTKLVRSLSDMILDEDEPLCRFDVYFRLRRLYHLTYRIADEMRRSDGAASSAWAALWERMNLHTEIADIIRHAMEYVLDHAKIAWKGRGHEEVWNDVRWRLERLLAARDGQGELSRLPNDASELKAFHARLMARAQTLLGGVEVPARLHRREGLRRARPAGVPGAGVHPRGGRRQVPRARGAGRVRPPRRHRLSAGVRIRPGEQGPHQDPAHQPARRTARLLEAQHRGQAGRRRAGPLRRLLQALVALERHPVGATRHRRPAAARADHARTPEGGHDQPGRQGQGVHPRSRRARRLDR